MEITTTSFAIHNTFFKYIVLFTDKNEERIKGNITGNYLKYQTLTVNSHSLTGTKKQAFLIPPKSQEVISIKKAKDWL